MKTLTLSNPAESEIKFELYKFPDGQQQIKIIQQLGKDNRQFRATQICERLKDCFYKHCVRSWLIHLPIQHP